MYYDNYDEDVRITEANGVIKSYFKTTYKDTEKIIEENRQFSDGLINNDEICIYGHSLSHIDFDYFREIHRCVSPNCKWHVSYFISEDYEKAIILIKS